MSETTTTENIQINIPNDGTVILATAGKYCNKNIEVEAKLQEKTATANGEVVADSGFAGLSKVTVAVPEPDGKIIDVTQLPTEDIDPDKYYRMDGKLYKYEEADTSTVEGTWVFDDDNKLDAELTTRQNESNDLTATCIFSTDDAEFDQIVTQFGSLCYNLSYPRAVYTIGSGWTKEAYKTIVVSSGSAEALSFLQATAAKQDSWQCYLVPSGSVTVTENGTVDVTDKKEVVVNVPIPEGYVKPEGDKEITENGTVDVTNFASVTVNVASSGGMLTASTRTEMDALLTAENVGKVVKYTGPNTSDWAKFNYRKNSLYVIKEVST